MRRMRKPLLLLIFTLAQIAFGQDSLDEGLFFYASEVNQDQRTSLNLNPTESFHFREKFSLEFEVNFRTPVVRPYGNIFKIICNDHVNIDMVANLSSEEDNFWLSIKDKILFKYKWSDLHKGDYNKWMKFNLEIDIENSQLAMTINGDKIIKSSENIEDLKDFKIIFGKSLYKNFSTTDVCPMSVKNIKIINKNGNPIRDWALGRHTTNNKVYDKLNDDEAIAKNPKWLIDQHVFWKKNKTFTFQNLLGSTKDKYNNRVFFIDAKGVHVYSYETDTLESYNYQGNPLKCQSNSFMYNHYTNELITYSIDESTYNVFNFDKFKWLNPDKACIETAYTGHNKIISPKDSTLITYGGYGYYKYKSSLKRFKPESKDVINTELNNEIPSRYLSSMGVLNPDTFLIFGGYGSSTGKQGLNSQFYYDLYTVGFEDSKVKKLWETDNVPTRPFVPVKSMVINNNSDTFYTLIYNNTIYNTSLKLARFGIASPEITIFNDSIPYEFIDIKSDADFFLNSGKTKLYTLTSKDNKANLYSLAYPPLSSLDLYQNEIAPPSNLLKYFVFGFIAFILSVILVIIVKKIKKSNKPVTKTVPINEEALEFTHSKVAKINQSSVYLIGGFQVFDNLGNDITAQFTPTLKELFIAVLLSGIKNKKGISSIKLTELLWPNKSENNARNNKNVNISKLRILLEKIGDIDINNENAYWKINVGDSVFCDYSFVRHLLDNSITTKLENEQVYKLLSIVSNGEVSPDIQSEWIDDYRTDLSDLIIDNLIRISKTQKDLQLLVLIGNTILKCGFLNEDAIAIKCKALYDLGKKGSAKRAYDEFSKEYFDVLDSNYDKSFNELIN
ncbi:hypothetical protein BST83_11600 [Polaribacter filamentus]|uniref:Galactose oxidase n=2 Tax=Polaribacter filamentus TaxID=53483 RepID=A0A2S7KZ19_9FLAO|nr:hypothetical protein BST83_11600 [Polaribacter filamentus]